MRDGRVTWVQCLAQGYLDMFPGGAAIQTADLEVCG